MNIPCAKQIPFIVCGLSFFQPELSNIQFQNLTMIVTALILGAKFNLTEISRMWLGEKAISTLSYFLSDAKLCTPQMQHLYALRVLHLYRPQGGYFLIDDTMKHHTKFCKWIHGVFVLFDHALGTNTKATCIVFLYYTDGHTINFPITFRIFYKNISITKWLHPKNFAFKTKYELALDMLQWAIDQGFPHCVVLADSWFGIDPFIGGLKKMKLSYILEIKSTLLVVVPCKTPKLTRTGKVAKAQYDKIKLPDYFDKILIATPCGFNFDVETHKKEKVLYITKCVTAQLNAIPDKHRIIESFDPRHDTTKYYLTNQLHFEAAKILSMYSNRWIIEEFFRNAKQLSDMEGATVRSEQGVTLALCLVSWIDFLLHHESYQQSTAGELTKESITLPSVVRRAQYENLKAVIEKAQQDEGFVSKWLHILKENMIRNRKKRKVLLTLKSSSINYCASS